VVGNQALVALVADLRRLGIQLPTVAIVAATCGTLLAVATRVPYDYPAGEVSAALAVLVAVVVVWGRMAAAVLRASATQSRGGSATASCGPAALPLAWVLLLMLLCGWVAIVLGVSAIAYSPGALDTSWAYDWALRNMWRVGVATVCGVVFAIEYVAALLAWRHRSRVGVEVRQLWRQMETEVHRLASDIIATGRRVR
jgi:hypothetical protein